MLFKKCHVEQLFHVHFNLFINVNKLVSIAINLKFRMSLTY